MSNVKSETKVLLKIKKPDSMNRVFLLIQLFHKAMSPRFRQAVISPAQAGLFFIRWLAFKIVIPIISLFS